MCGHTVAVGIFVKPEPQARKRRGRTGWQHGDISAELDRCDRVKVARKLALGHGTVHARAVIRRFGL